MRLEEGVIFRLRCGEQRQDLALVGRHAERVRRTDGERAGWKASVFRKVQRVRPA
jgi:hypothetical protein